MPNTFTDIPGLLVGHYTDAERGTGCTVVLCEAGAVAGVDVRGGAPGTRETDLLRPGNLVDQAHAILLTGGSAFGLGAAQGVVQYLYERGMGWSRPNRATNLPAVPIVPAAVIYDLGYGQPVWPTADHAYAACQSASREFAVGNVGAGTGATVGKLLGMAEAAKGGIGTASITLPDGTIVAALVVVNAFGDIRDASGEIVAGAMSEGGLVDTVAEMLKLPLMSVASPPTPPSQGGEQVEPAATNTTIGVVATNVPLTNAATTAIARMAHDGLSRTIRPCHTLVDGDTIFCLSPQRGDPGAMAISHLGILAAEVTARAVLSIWQLPSPTPSSRGGESCFSPDFGRGLG